MTDPVRWKGTRFLDPKMWAELIGSRHNWPKDNAPVNNFRFGPGGTVTRYGTEVSVRLQKGLHHRVREYYALNKGSM